MHLWGSMWKRWSTWLCLSLMLWTVAAESTHNHPTRTESFLVDLRGDAQRQPNRKFRSHRSSICRDRFVTRSGCRSEDPVRFC
jgi:hypothetical protein